MECDICGEVVKRKEDATFLEAIAYKKPLAVFLSKGRHIRCSPSRAQYIVHDDFDEMVDDRQAYDKRCLPVPMRESRESIWTSAWEILQEDEGGYS